MRARRCWFCGASAVRLNMDGALVCLLCGRTTPDPMPIAHTARLAGVSVRTVARWVASGLVMATPPMGSGRARLADAGGVLHLAALRRSQQGSCEWCGVALPPQEGIRPGVSLDRRWCSSRCKVAHYRATRLGDGTGE